MDSKHFIIVFPDIFTIITVIVISQVITTCYYAYNVFGRIQMQLRRTLLTPEQRELLAYDVPQSGAMASIISVIILTFLVYEIQFIHNIENYASAIFINLFLWLATSALSFTRYISYNLSVSLFLIDMFHDCLQLIGIAMTIQYFHKKNEVLNDSI